MGYYKSVGFCVTENVKQLLLSELSSEPEDIKTKIQYMLDNSDHHSTDPSTNAELYVWNDEKWTSVDSPTIDGLFDLEHIRTTGTAHAPHWISKFFSNAEDKDLDDEFLYMELGEERTDITIRGDYDDNPFDFYLVRQFNYKGMEDV